MQIKEQRILLRVDDGSIESLWKKDFQHFLVDDTQGFSCLLFFRWKFPTKSAHGLAVGFVMKEEEKDHQIPTTLVWKRRRNLFHQKWLNLYLSFVKKLFKVKKILLFPFWNAAFRISVLSVATLKPDSSDHFKPRGVETVSYEMFK